jgi:gliding motility-associated-like protein
MANPAKVDVAGTYYIMAKKNDGCGIVKPVDVKIGETPTVVIDNPTGCGKINIAAAGITAGSTPGIAYSYWQDAGATVPLTDLNNITSSGTYYLMAASTSGCSVIRPIDVTVNPLPVFTVTDPAPVVYPVQTVDITSAVNPINGVTYTYWLDSLTKKAVSNPRAINKRGRYFIRATNQFGCSAIKGVNANIIPPPEPIVYIPNAFTPNGDGLNDLLTVKLIGETSITQLRVYNRWGQLVYDDPDLSHQWNGKLKGIDLPAGVYVWTISGMDTYNKKPFARKGMITLIK